jgi:hypothetical protein
MAKERSWLITRQLCEQIQLGGGVDRDKGVIFNVKVCGTSSSNTHGVRGVDGTVYTLEALKKAIPLYEGVMCNIDHPPANKADQSRSAHDRFAWLEGVYVTESGLYADLHFLDAADPLAVKLMNAAESKPDCYALSHNAVGKGQVQDGKYVIFEIPEVRSVDIVAEGGSNKSLLEGSTMKKKVHDVLRDKVLPALKHGRKKYLQRLLQTSLSEARSPLMEADDGGDDDHRDHLYKAMRAAEDAGNEDGAKGVHKLLDPSKRNGAAADDDDGTSTEEGEEDDDEKDTEEGEGVEGPGEPGEGNEGPDGGRGKGATEGRHRHKLRRGEILLNEAQSLELCKSMEVEATANLMEILQGLSYPRAIKTITAIKEERKRRPSSVPRSTTSLRESSGAIPRDNETWCKTLRG